MRRDRSNVLIISWFLCLLFGLAGISKIVWHADFADALAMYRMDVTSLAVKCLRILLPVFEVSVSALLLQRKSRKLGLTCVILSLTAFTTAQLWAIMHGWHLTCGCFGPLFDTRVDKYSVGRNLACVILALSALALESTPNKTPPVS